MAKKKFGLTFEGLEDYMAKLDEVGGSAAMKRGVESALKASKQYVNPLINTAISSPNLPAGGKYSTGETHKSIDTQMKVVWDDSIGSIDVGFDFKKSGLTSIFLMYGTPKMKPVKGLKAAIYGAKTQRKISEIQGEAIRKAIARIMAG